MTLGSVEMSTMTATSGKAAGMTKDVGFEPGDGPTSDRIDEAYRAKYRRSQYLSPTISRRARSATVSIVPREAQT